MKEIFPVKCEEGNQVFMEFHSFNKQSKAYQLHKFISSVEEILFCTALHRRSSLDKQLFKQFRSAFSSLPTDDSTNDTMYATSRLETTRRTSLSRLINIHKQTIMPFPIFTNLWRRLLRPVILEIFPVIKSFIERIFLEMRSLLGALLQGETSCSFTRLKTKPCSQERASE